MELTITEIITGLTGITICITVTIREWLTWCKFKRSK